jgi:hypothetical protein
MIEHEHVGRAIDRLYVANELGQILRRQLVGGAGSAQRQIGGVTVDLEGGEH